jgi:hypothetical protein
VPQLEAAAARAALNEDARKQAEQRIKSALQAKEALMEAKREAYRKKQEDSERRKKFQVRSDVPTSAR